MTATTTMSIRLARLGCRGFRRLAIAKLQSVSAPASFSGSGARIGARHESRCRHAFAPCEAQLCSVHNATLC
jgi:hypothetical protein